MIKINKICLIMKKLQLYLKSMLLENKTIRKRESFQANQSNSFTKCAKKVKLIHHLYLIFFTVNLKCFRDMVMLLFVQQEQIHSIQFQTAAWLVTLTMFLMKNQNLKICWIHIQSKLEPIQTITEYSFLSLWRLDIILQLKT